MIEKASEIDEIDYANDGEAWEIGTQGGDFDQAEFEALDTQLVQLNSALDNLEQKTISIHAELIELLQSNREARKQFQEYRQEHDSGTSESSS